MSTVPGSSTSTDVPVVEIDDEATQLPDEDPDQCGQYPLTQKPAKSFKIYKPIKITSSAKTSAGPSTGTGGNTADQRIHQSSILDYYRCGTVEEIRPTLSDSQHAVGGRGDCCFVCLPSSPHTSVENFAAVVYTTVRDCMRPFIIQDILTPGSSGDCHQLIQRLEAAVAAFRVTGGRHRKDTTIIASLHDLPELPHIHIYHSCSYTKSWCSCAIMRNFTVRSQYRRSHRASDFDVNDWTSIIYYLLGARREFLSLEIGLNTWTYKGRCKLNESSEAGTYNGPETAMACCDVQITPVVQSSRADGNGDLTEDERAAASGDSVFTIPVRLPARANFIDIVGLYLRYPCSPIERLISINCWREDLRFQCLNPSGTVVQQALSYCRGQINKFTIGELYKMYNEATAPLFGYMSVEQCNDKYLTRRDTYSAVMQLLAFQYDNDPQRVDEFCNSLCSILDKTNGKRNSLWVMSSHSAGKNFFFDAVTAYFLNIGYISNPIRHNVFAFMDCVDRRVIMWNEAQCDSYFYEEVKALLAGDSPKVNYKMQGPKTVAPTPLIILSNRDTFPDNEEVNCRLCKYIWKTAPLLQQWSLKKPHPLYTLEVLIFFSQCCELNDEIIALISDVYTNIFINIE